MATCFRRGGIFNDHSIANLLLNTAVNKFRKILTQICVAVFTETVVVVVIVRPTKQCIVKPQKYVGRQRQRNINISSVSRSNL